jgi:hypothetical protein
MYASKYGRVGSCIDPVRDMVCLMSTNECCELEARFGRITNDKFSPGIERAKMDEILEMMQKSPHVKGEDEWKEEIDFFFTHNDKNIRSRVEYDGSLMKVKTSATEKKSLHPPIDFTHILSNGNRGDMDVRVSLKSEIPIPITDCPACVVPHLVRIKQRKRFVTENNKWAFDFSMTWSGKTKSEAETAQMNEDAVFELECELIENDLVDSKSAKYVATSILLKMSDFLDESDRLEF